MVADQQQELLLYSWLGASGGLRVFLRGWLGASVRTSGARHLTRRRRAQRLVHDLRRRLRRESTQHIGALFGNQKRRLDPRREHELPFLVLAVARSDLELVWVVPMSLSKRTRMVAV